MRGIGEQRGGPQPTWPQMIGWIFSFGGMAAVLMVIVCGAINAVGWLFSRL